MKRSILSLVAMSVAAVTACSPKPAAETAPAPVTANAGAAAPSATNMAAMEMAAGAKKAMGTGTVMAVDAAGGTVTLKHGPIPEAGWPAMTMAFKASPTVIGQVKAGESVDFDLKLKDGGGEVTAVRRTK